WRRVPAPERARERRRPRRLRTRRALPGWRRRRAPVSWLHEFEVEGFVARIVLEHVQRVRAGRELVAFEHDFQRDGRAWPLPVDGGDGFGALPGEPVEHHAVLMA